MKNEYFVFVYGTLKKGEYNNYILESGEYMCAGILEGYIMINLGAFPAIIPCSSTYDTIQGEIYKVNESVLMGLDRLEGVNQGLFTREEVGDFIQDENGDSIQVTSEEDIYAYVYGAIMEDGVR